MSVRSLVLGFLATAVMVALYLMLLASGSLFELPLGSRTASGSTRIQQAIGIFVFVGMFALVMIFAADWIDRLSTKTPISSFFPPFLANKIVILLVASFGAAISIDLLRDQIAMSWRWLYDPDARFFASGTSALLFVTSAWQGAQVLRNQMHWTRRQVVMFYTVVCAVALAIFTLALAF